jgi:hypothetical protein
LLAVCVILAACAKVALDYVTPAQKSVVDLQLETLNLHQRVLKGSPVWIGINQVAFTAFQEGANVEFPEENSKTDVLVIDTETKAIRKIVDDARIISFDRTSNKLLVARTHFSSSSDTSEEVVRLKTTYFKLTELRVLADNSVVITRIFPEGDELAAPARVLPKEGVFLAMEEPRDGYLLRVLRDGDNLLAQNKRAGDTDEALKTVWIRPNVPPTPLSVRYDEINNIKYVPFLDKFLLNELDSKQSSGTRKDMKRVWRRSYNLAPYRLLSRNGSIEEIPYPAWIKDFGLEEPKGPNGEGYDFNSLSVTKPGILIRKDFGHAANYFLYKNSQVYRLVAANAEDKVGEGLPILANSTWLELISPDGCKVAFTHRIVEMAESTSQDGYYLSIVKVCTDSVRR